MAWGDALFLSSVYRCYAPTAIYTQAHAFTTKKQDESVLLKMLIKCSFPLFKITSSVSARTNTCMHMQKKKKREQKRVGGGRGKKSIIKKILIHM